MSVMPSITLKPYKINWNDPADTGGAEIISYEIRFAINQGYTEWLDLESTDTRCLVLLPADVNITAEVRAVNDVGPGEAAVVILNDES